VFFLFFLLFFFSRFFSLRGRFLSGPRPRSDEQPYQSPEQQLL
jgi:hypothetical protein